MGRSLKAPTPEEVAAARATTFSSAPSPERVIRVRRILEYIGPEKWVKQTLAQSAIQPGKPVMTQADGVIAEVGRIEFKLDRESQRLSALAQLNHPIPNYPAKIRKVEEDDSDAA